MGRVEAPSLARSPQGQPGPTRAGCGKCARFFPLRSRSKLLNPDRCRELGLDQSKLITIQRKSLKITAPGRRPVL